MQCICGNWVHSSFGKKQFSLEMCADCLKASNSPSVWNREYTCEHVSDDTHLYNKEQNND